MDKLKPCPFCGPQERFTPMKAKERVTNAVCDVYIVCTNCGARSKSSVGSKVDYSGPIAAWNRRADKPRESDAEKKTG